MSTIKRIKAVLIPADVDAEIELMEIDNDLPTAQSLVGGFIESLPSRGDMGWQAYGNEDGKMLDLDVNIRAHVFLAGVAGHNCMDPITGPVLIVGFGQDGEWEDCPMSVGWFLHKIFRDQIHVQEGGQ